MSAENDWFTAYRRLEEKTGMNPDGHRANVSGTARLKDLPPLFRGGDLTLRFGWTSKNASQYLYLWRRAGLIEALGGKSDVYANLVRNRNPDWEKALRMAQPAAVLVGHEVLRRAGWITQIPARPEVALPLGKTPSAIHRFAFVHRSDAWFDAVRPKLRQDLSPLPALTPAWALADLLCGNKRRIALDPDDIDWGALKPKDLRDLHALPAFLRPERLIRWAGAHLDEQAEMRA